VNDYHRPERRLFLQGLSRILAAHPIQGSGLRKDACFSDEQHGIAGPDHRCALQEPLAGRAVLQVDQAAPAHQEVPGKQRERSQDANLVRHLRLCAYRHRQKGAKGVAGNNIYNSFGEMV
jgi:hypothetical protein